MRSRDVTIPLALWICAAICARILMFGTGGLVVAQMHDDKSMLVEALDARRRVWRSKPIKRSK